MFPFPTYPRVWLVHQTFSRKGKQVGRGLEAGTTLASKASLLPPGRRARRGTVEGQYLEGLDQFCYTWLQGNPLLCPLVLSGCNPVGRTEYIKRSMTSWSQAGGENGVGILGAHRETPCSGSRSLPPSCPLWAAEGTRPARVRMQKELIRI